MRPAAWIFLGVALCIVALTNWRLRALRPSFLRPQFTYSRLAFDSVIGQWTAEQRAEYRRLLRADFVTLACYGAFGALWVAGSPMLAGASAPTIVGWASCLPAAAAADAVENTLHLRFTQPGCPPRPDWHYRAAGLATAVKFALIACFAVFAVSAP